MSIVLKIASEGVLPSNYQFYDIYVSAIYDVLIKY